MRPYEDLLAEVIRQHPNDSEELQQYRAQVRFEQLNKPKAVEEEVVKEKPVEVPAEPPKPVVVEVPASPDYSTYFKLIIGLLLLLVFLCGKQAFGQIDGLQLQDSSGTKVKQWAAGVARIKFGTNLTISCEGTPLVCTIAAPTGPGAGVLTFNGESGLVTYNPDWNQSTPTAGDYIKNKPTLGTAAAKNIPATGNASATEVVYGSDTRLSDTRTPAAHDQAISTITGLQDALNGKQAAGSYEPANSNIQSHISSTSNPHSVTAAQAGAVAANGAITGATKTKITYDAKGLVTAGSDATTADIADSTDKRYVTDAQLTVIGNTSGTNTGDQTNITGNAGTATALSTGADRTKLDGIAAGAEVNVNADWDAVSGDAQILNKPTIPTTLAALSDDSTHRIVTDTEKSTWNGKAASNASTTVNGQSCALGGTCTVTNGTTTFYSTWSGVCQNTTASFPFDLDAANVPTAACVTGTNTTYAVDDFDAATAQAVKGSFMLPADWTGNIDLSINWMAAATSGSVKWGVATICVADAETGDPAYNTESTVTDAAKGTTLQHNTATISNVTVTGCAAGEQLYFKFRRIADDGADDMAGNARLISITWTVRRAL